MPATRLVPRAVRRGVLMALLVLTAVFAMVLSASGPGAGAVEVRTMSAAEGMGGGAPGESQPSDTADSELRSPGGSARCRKARARVRDAAPPCPRTRPAGSSVRAAAGPAPVPPRTVRCVVLRC
ncbi:hypothetical protein [Streptomyces sp. H27-C3]|uniref:hypothetical protein n=1 Tax=Streptomyces sp. H27-C3 TaxID=3046305 RepID=UPI0024BADE45|nr:hypothetical protein [Streptomyces sp. H27-C3]MDJ0461928.1 hypothetical protein [Streptomyces sp. H27-C3]